MVLGARRALIGRAWIGLCADLARYEFGPIARVFHCAGHFFLAHGHRVLAAGVVVAAGESDFHFDIGRVFSKQNPNSPNLFLLVQ